MAPRRAAHRRPRALAAALLFMVAAAALSSPALADWDQFRGDPAKTGNLQDPATPRPTGWTFEPAVASQLVASPVSDGNAVVIADYQGLLTSIDIFDGTTFWSQRTPDFITATPALSGDLVLVGSGKSLLAYRIQPSGSSVSLEWSFNTSARIDSSPTVQGGAVYFGSDDRSVYKVDLATGALAWSFQTADVVKASPSIHGGRVFVGSYDGKVYALGDNGSNVTLDWSFDAASPVAASAAVDGGTVYVCTQGGHVFALDEASGDQRWESAPGGVIVSSPAVVDGLLVIGGDTLAALDLQNGVVVWDRALGGYVRSSPAAADGVVYAGDYAGRLYAFRTDGGAAWSYDTGSAIRTSPALADGLVILGNDQGLIFALPIGAGEPPEVQPLAGRTTFEGVHETFSVVASDPEGRDVVYTWEFGDGSDASGRVVHHAYGSAGNYTVAVTVSDGQESTRVTGVVTVQPFVSEVAGGQGGGGGPGPADNIMLYLGGGAVAAAGVAGIVLLVYLRRRGGAEGRATRGGDGKERAPGKRARARARAKAKDGPAPGPQAPPAPAPASPPAEFDYYRRQYGQGPPAPGPGPRPPRNPRGPQP